MPHTWSRRALLSGLGGIAALAAPGIIRPAQAAGLLEKVKAAGVLRIGIADNIPWSRLNPDGTLTGVAPTIVQAIAKRLGIPKVEASVAGYALLVPGLNANRWDIIGASLAITPERCAQVLFSDPIYRDSQLHEWIGYLPGTIPVLPKTYGDLARNYEQIGMPSGSMVPYMEKAIAAVKGKARIVQFNDAQLMIEGLKAKHVPIVTSDTQTMHLLKEKMGGFEIAAVDSGVAFRGSGIAFRKEDADFREVFVKEQREINKTGFGFQVLKDFNIVYDENAMAMTGDEACALKDVPYDKL